MSLHVSLDLETLGTGSNAAIISIGACKFDPWADGGIDDRFHAHITFESAMKYGRADADTILWWIGQDQHARVTMLAAQDSAVELDEALSVFADWFGSEPLLVWGNGATFDNVILRNAFKACVIECPWGYYNDRCFRTLKNLSAVMAPPFEGVRHDALADAVHQAKWTQQIVAMRKLMVL
jgi:hypothetical protein